MIPDCRLCSFSGAVRYSDDEGHRYWRCTRCGFVFLFPQPSALELDRIYQDEEGRTYHHGAGIGEAYEKRLEARHRLRIVGPALASAPERSVLEVGCGAGYLLEHLRRSGWTVAGTEISRDYVRFARERLGLDVGAEFSKERRFGAVMLFDVLSHLSDPIEDLARFRDALLPGGVLVIETGNVAEVEPAKAGPLGAPEHLWHFSEANLRVHLNRLGFRGIHVRRFNVEWQRRFLGWLGRRRLRNPVEGCIGGAHTPHVGRALLKRLATHVLLGLRFVIGRYMADRHHPCTLIFTARR